MVSAATVERRSERKPITRLHEAERTRERPREEVKPEGVAERSARAPSSRSASDDTARETRARVGADPVAQQLRSRSQAVSGGASPSCRPSLAFGSLRAPLAASQVLRTKPPEPEPATDRLRRNQACAPGQVSEADYQRALSAERDLSAKRQELGRAQLELENRNVVERGWDWITNGDKDEQKKVDDLERQVRDLEEREKQLPAEAVEQARLTVFDERLAEVERTQGKGEAARLARQTYYNSPAWNGAAGTKPASEGEINAAGFPHGDYDGGTAVGGYNGEMRTRDGQVVDIGHVACALDWEVNKDRPANVYGNPFDRNAVTVSGDVASAMINTPAGENAQQRARDAVAREGDADWNGDLDGNNLAKRLERDPNASLAGTVRDYYDTGAYRTRVDEWATHSKYVEKDASGQPRRDADGHYVVNRDQLRKDASGFAKLLSKGEALLPGKDYAEREVVQAFQEWLNAHQEAPAAECLPA